MEEPQPWFHYIKEYYPHYHAGRGKHGHIVYYERPSDLNLPALKKLGLSPEQLLRHWLFVTEYQWRVYCENDDSAMAISVLDVRGLTLTDVVLGGLVGFLKNTVSIANHHYPERAYKIIVVNASSFFSTIYQMIRPFIDANTQEKIKIYTEAESFDGLNKEIEADLIPICYGGNLSYDTTGLRRGKPDYDDCCRFNSPEVQRLNEWVARINSQVQDRYNHCLYDSVDEYKEAAQREHDRILYGNGTTENGNGNERLGGMRTPARSQVTEESNISPLPQTPLSNEGRRYGGFVDSPSTTVMN